MHHEIARLEEENSQLRISRQREVNEMRRERIRMENERIRMEFAADRISAAETAAAERERKNNIREKLVQEAKMVGKVHGLAALSGLFNQANQIVKNNTNVQSVEAAPETPVLSSAEVSFDKMTPYEKWALTRNLLIKALEEVKVESK